MPRHARLALCLAAGLAASPAAAQIRQPRCGGFPPAQGVPGLVIGGAGQTCYGAIVRRTGGFTAMTDMRIEKLPASGRFELIGGRDFAYTPRAGQAAEDKVVLAIDFARNGETRTRRIAMRLTTETLYRAAGGSEAGPGPDTLAGRETHGGKGSRRGSRF